MTRLALALVLLAAACGNGDSATKSTVTTPPKEGEVAPPPARPAEPLRVEGGFATPESVLYDAAADLYYVSNINGSPFDTDGNGFISKVSPDGAIVELKWIDGLNAPKGMAIAGDTLWVSDITVVRTFDRASGEARGVIAIEGSTFLNDVASHGDLVYVSDSGMAPGFNPSGADAVYAISADGAVTPLAKDKALNRPNGLAYGDALYMVTFGANELYRVTDAGAEKLATLPKGGLDGLEIASAERVFVSSWECQCVYAGPLAGPFAPLVSNVKAPADIGWDAKRQRVLIPLFEDDAVLIQPAN